MYKKLKLYLPLMLIAIIFFSCSREDPNPITPPAPTPLAEVKMNEIYARGDSTNPDWVEIYNPNNSSVDIGGYKIYDIGGQSGSKPKKEIPSGTIIPAKGFYVIPVDDGTASGFGLSSSGEKIWLEKLAGVLIDSVTFPALGLDSSYARKPDGSNNWQIIFPPTKGSKNDTSIVITNPLLMNEIFSRGTAADPDWIEIYNPNNSPVDLSGYKIYDIGGQGGTKPKKEFPAGTTISAKGFFVIVVDDTTASGFGLSSSGEAVWLENASGVVIDNVTFPAMPVATTSYGRYPDGTTNWQILNTITKGSPNQQ